MWAQGTGEINFSGCSVTKPAGKGCVVSGGAVNTKKLFSTSKGLTNQVKIEPNAGTEFASIKIENHREGRQWFRPCRHIAPQPTVVTATRWSGGSSWAGRKPGPA